MLEAPKEKPKMGLIQSVDDEPEPAGGWKYQVRMETPSNPRPTTVKPMTAPLEKATVSALPRLVLAASVVLTALRVATRMPMKPAIALEIAP